ncbi:hypothetical protein VKT23_019779 [Stygiomarasmius scandens]|uniref:HET-domain-containing protein n=1 Tax=Marasmiellus scandens TaxID=2682957 RepID=A0ABR1IPN2_9AGAR
MRLLSTLTLTLHEFATNAPSYAILSHTWGKEEVTFQDIKHLKTAKKRAGYRKIQSACEHARKYGFDFIWIDSCCIDKESSTELSEALNSMYKYYQGAQVCYAHLSDVDSKEDPSPIGSSFRRSKWFTRGWTLQELLAPSVVVFLGTDWLEIGSKTSLRNVITAVTGIPPRVLLRNDYSNISIAQKMSWAAWRETTREEDQAYSLMGMFGVNMPPIYGEGGERAFLRLQQEIIRSSNDRSIFAWSVQSDKTDEYDGRGLLARSPSEFRASGEVTVSDVGEVDERSSYSMTNNGLHIYLPFSDSEDQNEPHLAFLHCRSEKTGEHLAIWLKRERGRQYVRCRANELVLKQSTLPLDEMREIFVKEVDTALRGLVGVALPILPTRYVVKKLSSSRQFVCDKLIFSTEDPLHQSSLEELESKNGWLVTIQNSTSDGFALKFRTDRDVFIALVGIKDGAAFANVITGPNCASLDNILGPYHCYGGQDCRYQDRIMKSLPGGGIVRLVLQNTDKPEAKILELSIVAESEGLLPGGVVKDSRSPDFGFMIDAIGTYQLEVIDVYPPDFFMNPRQWNSKFFMSIDLNEPCPCRLIAFRISGLDDSSGFGVVFGIEGSEAWVNTFKDCSNLSASFKSRYERRILATEQRLMIEDKINTQEEFCVTITVGRRKTVQDGSHWAQVRVEKVEKGALEEDFGRGFINGSKDTLSSSSITFKM